MLLNINHLFPSYLYLCIFTPTDGINCHITGDNRFALERRGTDKYGLLIITPFDYENPLDSSHRLQLSVVCNDKAPPEKSVTSEVIVEVMEVNDNKPRFLSSEGEMHAYIIKDNAIGSVVYRLNASDDDVISNLIYSLDQQYEDLLDIDQVGVFLP